MRRFTPFVSGSELRVVGKVAKGVTGTRIRYWADPQIFTKGTQFQADDLTDRLRQTAFLVPGLALDVVDERGEAPVKETFRFDGGISEFAEYLAVDAALTETWRMTGSGTFTETVPVLQENGHMVPTELERECGSTSRCAGAPATTRCSRASSTSSRRRRAAATSSGSSRGC